MYAGLTLAICVWSLFAKPVYSAPVADDTVVSGPTESPDVVTYHQFMAWQTAILIIVLLNLILFVTFVSIVAKEAATVIKRVEENKFYRFVACLCCKGSDYDTVS